MAKKRMFDKAIIDTDRFMDLSLSMKGLYFLLGMEADDEGFVSPKKVMRIHGGSEDDLKVLIVKNFVIPFDSGVVVITDWNKNNWLDSRRISPTEYQNEKNLLELTESGIYVLSNGLASIEEKRREENSRVENRKDAKASFGEMQKVKLTQEEYVKLVDKMGETNLLILITELDLYLASKPKKYASHYAVIQTWARRRVQEHQNKTTRVGKL